jgi:hypothetical protein
MNDTVAGMAFDDALAERIRDRVPEAGGVHENRMFGWLVFLTDGNMAVGARGGRRGGA